MKYIDAEKLKRFVGELKERAKRNRCDSWGIVPDALEEVEGFITSLQQEQQPSLPFKLDNAAEEYAQDETMSGLAERAFKAGAGWQREQYECIPAEESYMRGFAQGSKEERKRMLEDIIKMRDTAEKRGLNFGAVCGFQIALDELEQRLTGKLARKEG